MLKNSCAAEFFLCSAPSRKVGIKKINGLAKNAICGQAEKGIESC